MSPLTICGTAARTPVPPISHGWSVDRTAPTARSRRRAIRLPSRSSTPPLPPTGLVLDEVNFAGAHLVTEAAEVLEDLVHDGFFRTRRLRQHQVEDEPASPKNAPRASTLLGAGDGGTPSR